MWNSGTLARSQESTECELFFFSTSLSCSLSFPSVSSLPLSFFSLRAGVSYISPVSPGEGDWRTEREGLGLKHPAVFDSHWNSLKPTRNKWSERIRHLRSKSPFFFFFFFFFNLLQTFVWDCRILTLTNFPETSECTLKFPGGISQWELQLDVWTPCTFFCGVSAVCMAD